MRRLALTPLLAVALACSLAGCGSSSGSPATPGGEEAAGSQLGSEGGESAEGESAAGEGEGNGEERELPSGEGAEGSSEAHELERAKELFEEGGAGGEGEGERGHEGALEEGEEAGAQQSPGEPPTVGRESKET